MSEWLRCESLFIVMSIRWRCVCRSQCHARDGPGRLSISSTGRDRGRRLYFNSWGAPTTFIERSLPSLPATELDGMLVDDSRATFSMKLTIP